MKLRYVLFNAYAAGGTARTVLHQANALCGDHEVEVASVYRHRERPRFAVDPRVRLVPLTGWGSSGRPWDGSAGTRSVGRWTRRLPTLGDHRHDPRFRRWDPWVDRAVRTYLASAEDGVLITTRPGLNLIAARSGTGGAVRVAQEHMNLDSHGPGLRRAILRSYGRLDAVVTLTPQDADRYRAALPRHEKSTTRVLAIGNGVPAPTGPPATPDARVVAAAGRLTRQKGFDLLLQAWAQVVVDHPGWQLRIHGAGPERDALQAQLERLGLQDSAQLPGLSRVLDDRLREASIYALSSRHEGFPMVLLEAMSVGLAPVAFDCPTGPAQILTDGTDGLLVPPGDVGALAASLARVIGDPALRRSLAAAAAVSSRRHQIDAVVPQWTDLFKELVPDRDA